MHPGWSWSRRRAVMTASATRGVRVEKVQVHRGKCANRVSETLWRRMRRRRKRSHRFAEFQLASTCWLRSASTRQGSISRICGEVTLQSQFRKGANVILPLNRTGRTSKIVACWSGKGAMDLTMLGYSGATELQQYHSTAVPVDRVPTLARLVGLFKLPATRQTERRFRRAIGDGSQQVSYPALDTRDTGTSAMLIQRL